MPRHTLIHTKGIAGIHKWHLKAVVQKCISVLPNPEKANHVFQKFVTKGVELNDEHFGFKIQHASDHLRYTKAYLKNAEKLEILELGTGWYPIVPISMYLSNLGEVTSIDIQSWLSRESFITTVLKMKDWRDSGKLQEHLTDIDESRWDKLIEFTKAENSSSLEEMNTTIGLKPLLIDARNTGLPADHFDLICSNNTFEHVFPDVLNGILVEFKRLIKPGGLMSHFIDLSDHFAHFDSSINIYNFLRFSKRRWDLIDNSIQPQNRLRWKDYLAMYDEIGIPITEEVIRDGDVQQLKEVPLHSEYRNYTPTELAVSHGYIISLFP